MIRVLVADDQPLVRLGLRVLLEAEDDITVAGEAADGRTLVALAQASRPDVVVMDVRLPVMDGISALQAMSGDPDLAGIRTVILTSLEHDEYLFPALRSGAAGFLSKNSHPAELIRAVRVAAAGDSLLSPTVTRRVIDELVATAAPRITLDPRLALLTERERQTVALVAEGLANEEIAKRLSVSPATARTHVSHAMIKLGARDRTQLVIFAFQSGLASPGGR